MIITTPYLQVTNLLTIALQVWVLKREGQPDQAAPWLFYASLSLERGKHYNFNNLIYLIYLIYI